MDCKCKYLTDAAAGQSLALVCTSYSLPLPSSFDGSFICISIHTISLMPSLRHTCRLIFQIGVIADSPGNGAYTAKAAGSVSPVHSFDPCDPDPLLLQLGADVWEYYFQE